MCLNRPAQRHLFLHSCSDNCSATFSRSRSSKVRSPGQVKWPHLRKKKLSNRVTAAVVERKIWNFQTLYTTKQGCNLWLNWVKLPPFCSQPVEALAGCQQRPERWRTEVLDFCTGSHKSSSFTRRKSRTSNNPVPVLRIPSKYGWMSCSLNESKLNQLRHKLQPCYQVPTTFISRIFYIGDPRSGQFHDLPIISQGGKTQIPQILIRSVQIVQNHAQLGYCW